MSTTKDALGTQQTFNPAANGTFNYTGLTVVSNTNGAIVLIIWTGANTDTMASVTGYTKIGTADASDNTWHQELWGKVGNSTGLQTIAITTSGTYTGTNIQVSAISVTGANQTGGATTFKNFATNVGTSTNSTLNVTTAVTDLSVAMVSINNDASAFTHTTIISNTAGTPSIFASYDQNDATSPSVFATTGGTASVVWVTAGVDIAVAASGVIEEEPSYTPRQFMRQWNVDRNLLLHRRAGPEFSLGVETNPHYRGRTWPQQWNVDKALLLHRRAGPEFSFGVETNTHWIGKAQPRQWNINAALWQNPAIDVLVIDRPIYFIPRIYSMQWSPDWRLWRITAQDFSSFGVETNPHWRGKTWSTWWNVNDSPLWNSAGDTSIVFDTPPPFVSKTWSIQWNQTRKLWQTDPQDSSSFGVETNPQWQGKVWPVRLNLQPALWQNAATDVPIIISDTPPHFAPFQHETQWNVDVSLVQGGAQDGSGTSVETNVQFIARSWPVQWNILRALWQTTAQDFSSFGVETNPHWINTPYMWPRPWQIQASLMQGAPQDLSTVITPPTDVQHLWGFSIIRKPL